MGEIPTLYEDAEEYIRDNGEDQGFVIINNKLYQVEFEARREDLHEIAEADKNDDGSIEFVTYHYNGGAHWTDVVEDALKKGE